MIKIVTWNIRHALGNDGLVDIDRIGKKLKSLNADIYAVQEIDIFTERSGEVNQVKALEKVLGTPSTFTQLCETDGGLFGLATFSRLKTEGVTHLKIANVKENNSAQMIRFRVKNSVFDFVNLHAPRVHKVTYWKNFHKNYDFSDCILCGDFNLNANDEILLNLKEKYTYINEEDTWDAGEVLDYTFIPKKSLKILSQTVEPSSYSDHNILITTLDLW